MAQLVREEMGESRLVGPVGRPPAAKGAWAADYRQGEPEGLAEALSVPNLVAP